MKNNSRTADKFVIRLPDGLRDLYREQAQLNGRSMNSEMVKVLQEGVGIKPETGHSALEAHEARIRRLEQAIIDFKSLT